MKRPKLSPQTTRAEAAQRRVGNKELRAPLMRRETMPSVSATHGWILWEIAKSRLQDAGYRVEKHGNRLAAYHGIGLTTCFPDFLSINDGKCSPRTVERLIKKLRR